MEPVLHHGHVQRILDGIRARHGRAAVDGPVASGRVGAIWRLDTELGPWAVKEVVNVDSDERTELLEGAAFQEAAHAAGVPVPAVQRSVGGEVIARVDDAEARVLEWVDLEPPDLWLDPVLT